MDGIVNPSSASFNSIYAALFIQPNTRPSVSAAKRIRKLAQNQHYDDFGQILSKLANNHFGIIAITLSEEIRGVELEKALDDFKFILDANPNKILAVISSSEFSVVSKERINKKFKGRIFIFDSITDKDFLIKLFQGKFKEFNPDNRLTAQLFHRKSRLLAKKTYGKLPPMWLLKNSLIVAPDSVFSGGLYLNEASKKFLRVSIKNLSDLDLFAAHLFYGFWLMGPNNSELLRDKIPDELDVKGREGNYTICFRLDFAEQISEMIQSIRAILASA